MKKTLILLMLLSGMAMSLRSAEQLPGKQVRIGPKDFSKVYAAVWFCPEKADVIPITKREEVPDDPAYRIWIEPGDPEINVVPIEGEKKKGTFVHIGSGTNAYVHAKKGMKGRAHRSLGGEELGAKQPVFIYREKDHEWVFMVVALDAKAQTLSMMWRVLK